MVSVCDLCEIYARSPYRGRKCLWNVYYVPGLSVIYFTYVSIYEHVSTFEPQSN